MADTVMDGIVYTPPPPDPHTCEPPLRHRVWTTHPVVDDDSPPPFSSEWVSGRAPDGRIADGLASNRHADLYSHPDATPGAIWRCAVCRRYWTVRIAPTTPGLIGEPRTEWTPSTWLERRRARKHGRP